MVSLHEPDRIYCARFESPLLIGTRADATYLGSDVNAFLGFTRSVIALEDGQYAILLPGHVCVKDIATRQTQAKTVLDVDWNVESAQKGGHPHFMIKEIHEQPQTVIRAAEVDTAAIDGLAAMIARYRQTYLVGVGNHVLRGADGPVLLLLARPHLHSCDQLRRVPLARPRGRGHPRHRDLAIGRDV